jgi:hypothetical protein
MITWWMFRPVGGQFLEIPGFWIQANQILFEYEITLNLGKSCWEGTVHANTLVSLASRPLILRLRAFYSLRLDRGKCLLGRRRCLLSVGLGYRRPPKP